MSQRADEAAIEAALTTLRACDEYRVLKKFVPMDAYGPGPSTEETSVCFLDVETTGTEEHDVPIELGMVRVAYDADTGELGKVLERATGLEQPPFAIPKNIVALTGITDDDVKGRSFDSQLFKGVVQRSSIVVSHNAGFDRPMVEKRFPWMARRAWACTMSDVPWAEYGVASKKLEFVAMTRGLFYGAHRAQEDAEVAAAIAGAQLGDGKPAFWWVLAQARENWYRVWATDAPFEKKTVLKQAGYVWCDGTRQEHKAWRCTTTAPVEELDFLAKDVFGGRGKALLQEIGKLDRFTERAKTSEWISMAAR